MINQLEHEPDLIIHLIKTAQSEGLLPEDVNTTKVVSVIAATYAEHVDAVRRGEAKVFKG